MKITLDIDITKLTEQQKKDLGKITDNSLGPLKKVVEIKADIWERTGQGTPEYLRARAKGEIVEN